MDELLPDDSLSSTAALFDDSGYEIVSRSGVYTPDEPIDSLQIGPSSGGFFAGVDASMGLYFGIFVIILALVCAMYFIFRYFRSSKR